MKLSAVFVTIAAAFTGSANAAEITNGNLRATSLAKAEIFEEPSKIEQLDGCVAECIVGLKQPSKKEVLKIDKKDITGLMEACSNTCFDDVAGDNEAVRSALESQLDRKCAAECAKSASKKFKTVDKDCDNTKNCKKCNKSDKEEDADKYEECMDEYKKCEDCKDQIEEAQSSVEKVTKAMVNCAPACTLDLAPNTDIEEPEVFEEPVASPSYEGFKECVTHQCALGKPKEKDVQKATEEEVEGYLGQCVDTCFGIDQATRDAMASVCSLECTQKCTEEAAKKFKEVSKDCDDKKDIKCENCNGLVGEELDKCEELKDECEECEKEVEEAQDSVKKVEQEMENCLPTCCPPTEYQTYIELA